MRTLTGLSGEYVTFDQNVQKSEVGTRILLMQLTENIDDFNKLVVLIVHFDERGRVNLEFQLNS